MNQKTESAKTDVLLDENKKEEEGCMELLASIGVPFAPDGTPLGIGWDD